MTGLGLNGFLNHSTENVSSRKFLRDWRNEGEKIVWLYTQSDIAWISWNHPFIEYGTFKDENGNEHECLRYPRFVSPDPEIVHKSQYFNDERGRMKVPPMRDPFLLLREWLKHECDLPLDTVIFRWENPRPKPGSESVIEWRRSHLSRLEKRGRYTYNHTLDTKLDYFFVVVENEAPENGPQIVRVTKLLGDAMKNEIGKQIDSKGDFGNPLINPYAFKWKFNRDAPSPMAMYDAYRYDKADLTNAIKDAINSPSFPDPSQDCRPRIGDKMRIRAAMEAAAQVEIPWDKIFVSEWVDEECDFDKKIESVSKNSGRRKKKNLESPEVKIEKIPCDDCGEMILATDAKCFKCGAEYEIEGDKSEECVEDSGGEFCFSCNGKIVNSKCQNCGLVSDDCIPF